MPNFIHNPVMVAEALAALQPRAGGSYADGTLGGGSHAAAVLEASSPSGRLFGCDRDGAALKAAAAKLAKFSDRFELRHGNYADLAAWVAPGSCDGVLLDLGVSSPQLDWPERGFSFDADGPLDMRLDPSQGTTAATLVNANSADELANIFFEYGGEEQSRRMARAIVRQREESGPITRTRPLAELIARVSPRAGRKRHPATRVFQALRIAVNDELGSLRRGLEAALTILKPGGRLAVICFHSLEERVVKEYGQRLSRDYEPASGVDVPELRQPRPPLVKWICRKALAPTEAEIQSNPRSRSARMRVLEKC